MLLTGNGPSPKDGGWAFCSGGDQRVRGRYGYEHAAGSSGRLHILEAQRLIRFMPKVVVCVVPGWAAGGGHSLHVVSDLTLASAEHARFKQTDADVGSFDGGFGSAYLARQVGQKFAREIFFLGEEYTAADAHAMGMVNRVVPHAELERTALDWGRRIVAKSPTAQRMLKYSFNLIDDGLVGQQLFAGETTRLAYMAEEAVEGRDAFLEKRDPDFSRFPWHVPPSHAGVATVADEIGGRGDRRGGRGRGGASRGAGGRRRRAEPGRLALGEVTDEEADEALRAAGLGRLAGADTAVLDVAALRAAAEAAAPAPRSGPAGGRNSGAGASADGTLRVTVQSAAGA